MHKKIRVLFRVDASKEIGFGHLIRTLALANILKNEYDCEFVTASKREAVESIISANGFSIMYLTDIDPFKDHQNYQEVPFDLDHIIKGNEIVVLDGYLFGKKYIKALKKKGAKVVLIEDSGSGEYFADLVINHAPGLNPNNYSGNNNLQLALGSDYALLRPTFLKEAKKKLPYRGCLQNLFICFGGSDYNDFTYKISEWFLHNTNVKINAVVGLGYSNIKKLNYLASNFNGRLEVNFNLNEEDLKDTLQKNDFAIVPSSGILYECIACRIPSISGYYIDNQYQIYKGWKDLGAFIDAGNLFETDWNKAFRDLQNADLHKFTNRLQTLIDGKSDQRLSICFKNLTT